MLNQGNSVSDLVGIYPLLINVLGAIFILILIAFKKDLHHKVVAVFTLATLAVSTICLFNNSEVYNIYNLILVDGISKISQSIVLISSIMFTLLTLSGRSFPDTRKPEFYFMILTATFGYQLLASSTNFMVVLLALEIASLSTYTMVAMHNDKYSLEAGLKYFVMGALSLGVMLFGIMMLYLASGSLDVREIAFNLVDSKFSPITIVSVGAVLIVASIAFKVSSFPFHSYAPDLYEGGASHTIAYVSIAPKIAITTFAFRVFDIFVVNELNMVLIVMFIIAIFTMTVPNILALVQRDVKRMLAFSSIAHSGFIFSAILVNNYVATSGIYAYWVLLMFSNFLAFTVLWSMYDGNGERYVTSFDKLAGLATRNKGMAFALTLSMVSLAGIPPFGLFWGKLYLIDSTLYSDYPILAIFMIINSMLAVFYYSKTIVYIYFRKPDASIDLSHDPAVNCSFATKIVISVSAFVVIFAMFFLDDLVIFITECLKENLANI